MRVELYAITPNAELVIEHAARCCYDSENKIGDKVNGEFLMSLIRQGHTSVLEHATATFVISGVTRALSHQLVRHRIASYSQKSQRYVKEGEVATNYSMPDSFDTCEFIDDFTDHMELTEERYNAYIANGIPAEDARAILPNATHTKLYMTMNMAQWRWFLHMRGSRKAQKEIRRMAFMIWEQLKTVCPHIFSDFRYQQAYPNDPNFSIERPDYINPKGYIWYKGRTYKTADLINTYRERNNLNATEKEKE